MTDNPKSPEEISNAEKSAASDEKSKNSLASTAGPSRQLEVKRVDHTPPPLLIREGSLVVETDVNFSEVDALGATAAHPHRHKFDGNRKIMGLKIQDDAGDTVYLNGDARDCSVKIWWTAPEGPEQIFVNADNFTVETDQPLGASVATGHSRPKRERRYTHPTPTANELVKVVVVKGTDTLFSGTRRIAQVMIWDTRD